MKNNFRLVLCLQIYQFAIEKAYFNSLCHQWMSFCRVISCGTCFVTEAKCSESFSIFFSPSWCVIFYLEVWPEMLCFVLVQIVQNHITLYHITTCGGGLVKRPIQSWEVSSWSDGDCHQMETFPPYWPFVRGTHRWPVNSPHKGQWRGALMFSLISVWINDWVNNRDSGDLRRHRAHYDVTVMPSFRFTHLHIKHLWCYVSRHLFHNTKYRTKIVINSYCHVFMGIVQKLLFNRHEITSDKHY